MTQETTSFVLYKDKETLIREILSQKMSSISPEEKEDVELPTKDLIDFVIDLVNKHMRFNTRLLSVDLDYSGGILLDFTGGLEVGVNSNRSFFPSKDESKIERFYKFEEFTDFLDLYFKENALDDDEILVKAVEYLTNIEFDIAA